jgi:prepilin signal peptidase PulO-like enzyme (type II secretory pathway)
MLLIPSLATELHLIVLFAIGATLGSIVNWAIFSLRFNPVPKSPWSDTHPRDALDGWQDRLPLVGWWRLRRKGKTLGYEFWIRPLVIEIFCGLLATGLYAWEVVEFGLVLNIDAGLPQAGQLPPLTTTATVHAQFVAHLVLVLFMVAVSFIDIDEQTIPDEVTLPGTLLGLVLMTLLPMGRLPDVPMVFVDPSAVAIGESTIRFMQVSSPWNLYAAVGSVPHVAGLALGVGCLWLWCFGLLPRRWRGRHGWKRATHLIWARITRHPSTKIVLTVAIIGALGILVTWVIGRSLWESLLSSLVGLAVGGLAIWSIRIAAWFGLRREGMGFGDVTLMAMIGVYLGWQAALISIALAVFFALALGLVQLVVRRDNVIPFGPFLCLGALATIVRWPELWLRLHETFMTAWLLPVTLGLCLVFLLATLWTLRRIRGY